jgi:hypothetical protein
LNLIFQKNETGKFTLSTIECKNIVIENFTNQKEININTNLPRGIYFTRIESNGYFITKKIIKN